MVVFTRAAAAAGENRVSLALFSYSLRFPHPVTKQAMCFKAYPPLDKKPWDDFAAFIEGYISVK